MCDKVLQGYGRPLMVYSLNPNDDSFCSQKLEEADASSSAFCFELRSGLGNRHGRLGDLFHK